MPRAFWECSSSTIFRPSSRNPTLEKLWPLSAPLAPPRGALTVSGRPLLNLSFAVNQAISGTAPWSYHLLNLLIHAGGALALSELCGGRSGFGRRPPFQANRIRIFWPGRSRLSGWCIR